MNRKSLTFTFLGMVFLFSCSQAEVLMAPLTTAKEIKMQKADNDSKESFYIEGNEVSRNAYQNFIKTLLPKRLEESCADGIDDGGRISYSLKDKSGNLYRVEEISNVNSVRINRAYKQEAK
jgi:hypothetical protein